MVEFFHRFPLLDPIDGQLEDENRFDSGKTTNLFKKWDRIGDGKDISLDQIAETIDWIKKYTDNSSESYLEDLDWTHHSLLNSMDEELNESVTSTLKHQFDSEDEGGPLTFAVMIDKCINLSEEAIESLKHSVEKYDIKNVKGEDISVVCRRFLYALKRLQSNDAVTPSLIKALFRVFQTSSVPEFNDFVAHWSRDVSRRGVKKPTFNEILSEVEDYYKRLRASGEWCGLNQKENTESAFIGEHHKSSGQAREGGHESNTPNPYSKPTEAD
jgi:hypothetical protein